MGGSRSQGGAKQERNYRPRELCAHGGALDLFAPGGLDGGASLGGGAEEDERVAAGAGSGEGAIERAVRREQRHQIALAHMGGQVAHPERVRHKDPSSGGAPAGDGALRRGCGVGRLRGLRGRRLRRHRRRGGAEGE